MAMSWEQLLGGYATNTLTEEEKRQLFEAALHDQALFEALADEEALKALLDNPEARQRILESLRVHEKANQSASPGGNGKGWFRQHSTLAWVGSIAAMGLALIFGWQMEKDWGPIVQQEQEAAKSSSPDSAEFHTREPQAEREDAEQMVALKKAASQPEPTRDEPLSPSETRQGQTVEPASPVTEIDQVQAPPKKEQPYREEAPVSQVFGDQKQPSHVSGKVFEQTQLQVDPAVPPVGLADVVEVAKSENAAPMPASKPAAGPVTMEESGLPPGPLDLFYAGLGLKESDDQAAKTDLDNLFTERAISESSKPSAREKRRLSVGAKLPGNEAVIQKAQGVRYSFVRITKDGEEEVADAQQITGDWRQVRLTIEPNEPGYLYVWAPLGNARWQPLRGMMVFEPGDDPRSGKVNAYRVVEYRLGNLTNLLGKLVVPSVTVLFSPTPLDSGGPWLRGSTDLSHLQIERTDHSVYVVRPGPASEAPLRVDIMFE